MIRENDLFFSVSESILFDTLPESNRKGGNSSGLLPPLRFIHTPGGLLGSFLFPGSFSLWCGLK